MLGLPIAGTVPDDSCSCGMKAYTANRMKSAAVDLMSPQRPRRAAGCMLRRLAMPVARLPADNACLAVYTLTGGRPLQGKLVTTLA